MNNDLIQAFSWLQENPPVFTTVMILGLMLVAWIADLIVKGILIRGFYRLLHSMTDKKAIAGNRVVARLAHTVPSLIMSLGIHWIPGLHGTVVTIIENVANAYIILTLALAASAFLNVLNDLWQQRPDARMRPIKGYIQVGKILVYLVAGILIVASLVDRSPLILLSGLGAMAAVLMLIFQDTLLSLVASIQITSNDIVRVGDWIEMPQLNADGFVIDIALHTIKVQNFDKTITTIPTKRLIADSFKNWRGMQESGGRRIKRSIFLDQNSMHFISEEERRKLYRFSLLRGYLDGKQHELSEWNGKLPVDGSDMVNTRRLTNIGCFRAYVRQYLKHHPGINQDMWMLVRHMPLSAQGLPLEVYCFTNTVAWVDYETIQSDIFDHLLAILPEFGLRVFQEPSGMDVISLSKVLQHPVVTVVEEAFQD